MEDAEMYDMLKLLLSLIADLITDLITQASNAW